MNQMKNDVSSETNHQGNDDERVIGNIQAPWMTAGVTLINLIAVCAIPHKGAYVNREGPNPAESMGAFMGVLIIMTAIGLIVAAPLWFIAKSLIEPRRLSFRPFLLIGMICGLCVIALGGKIQAAQANQSAVATSLASVETGASQSAGPSHTTPQAIGNIPNPNAPMANLPTPAISPTAQLITNLLPLFLIGGFFWVFLRRYGKSPFIMRSLTYYERSEQHMKQIEATLERIAVALENLDKNAKER